MKLYLLLFFLLALFSYSFYDAIKSKKGITTTIATLSFVAFVTIYCYGVLGYNVTGPYWSLSERVSQVEETQKQLKSITQTLTKMAIVLDVDKVASGYAPQANKLIELYKKELAPYLGPTFENELQIELE